MTGSPSRRDVAVPAAAVLLSFVLFSAGGPPAPDPGPERAAATAVLALAMGLPLLWRRLRPEAVAVAVVAAACTYAVALGPVPPFALWFALFAVVVHAVTSRRALVAGALTGLGTVVAVVLGPVAHGRGSGGVLPTLLLTLVVALAAALLRTERGRVEALRQRALSLERERDAAAREAAAEERLRIARDLHDLVGHGLSSLAVQSSTARVLLDNGEHARAGEQLRAVEATTRTALREMRQLLGVLREDGSSREPSPGLPDLPRLVAAAEGVDATLVTPGLPSVAPGVGLAAYRVVQECLTNARKHAPGSSVSVRVTVDDGELDLLVEDTGGTRTAPRADGGGHGLLGVRERVAALGGTVTAGPHGTGWRVHARLPLGGTA